MVSNCRVGGKGGAVRLGGFCMFEETDWGGSIVAFEGMGRMGGRGVFRSVAIGGAAVVVVVVVVVVVGRPVAERFGVVSC